jgi:hypothetical protein
VGMPSGNLNPSQLVSQQPLQDDNHGDNSLVSLPCLKMMTRIDGATYHEMDGCMIESAWWSLFSLLKVLQLPY